MASLDLDLAHFLGRKRRTDLALDALGSGFADQGAIVAAHVVDDGLIELVATHPNRCGIDDAIQGHHRHLGGAAAHIQHHRTTRLMHRDAGPHGGGDWFLDQVNPTRAGTGSGFLDGAPLDLGRAVGHAHQHTRAGAEIGRVVHLADEVLEHLLGGGEVGNDAFLQRPDGGDVAGGAAHHGLGGGALCLDGLAAAIAVVADGHHGGLIEDDALAAGIDQRVGCPQINGQVVGEKSPKPFEFQHEGS